MQYLFKCCCVVPVLQRKMLNFIPFIKREPSTFSPHAPPSGGGKKEQTGCFTFLQGACCRQLASSVTAAGRGGCRARCRDALCSLLFHEQLCAHRLPLEIKHKELREDQKFYKIKIYCLHPRFIVFVRCKSMTKTFAVTTVLKFLK